MLSILKHLLTMRLWERQNIPLLTPVISLDVLLLAAVAKLEERELATKSFHLSLGYSEDRTREVIQELEGAGWLSSCPSAYDRRTKIVFATDKLMGVMEEYSNLLRSGVEPNIASTIFNRTDSGADGHRPEINGLTEFSAT